MTSAHPFLDIDHIFHHALRQLVRVDLGRLIDFGLLATLQVTPEVLKQGNFLLEFFRVLSKSVLFAEILSVGLPPFVVVEVVAVGVEHNLCRVIKVDTCRFVREIIAEAVLGRIVDPLLDPDF